MDDFILDFDDINKPPQKDNGRWIIWVLVITFAVAAIGCFMEQWLFDMPNLAQMNREYKHEKMD